MSRSAEINLNLHPKQARALDTEANEVLYGGAAGGGKSHLMRVAAILWCAAIPGLQVYFFRRIRDDLIKNHMEGPKGFRSMLAPWALCGLVRIVDDEIRFWNGSKIYLCHCKDEKDIYKYQGAEIHVLVVDELTHFTESMYRFLRNRVRMVGIVLGPEWYGKFPRILVGANPGNIGHLFVKATFIEGSRPFEIRHMPPEEGGMRRQYIPALLEDNPSMTADDPGYEARLQGLGSKQLVEAMRYGNWDVVEGAYFDCWDPKRHVVRPFELPRSWTRFGSGDWGSAKPFSFGWWAVVSDQVSIENQFGAMVTLPRGCLIRYREWYGKTSPNVGLKLDNERIGAGIAEREQKDEQVSYRVLDPACFSANGGKTIAQQMTDGSPANKRIHFREADNTRVAGIGAATGWAQMRTRFNGDGDGNPMVVTFATCLDSIRTIPALQHDKTKPEDLDTDGEDHAADDWRYGCNSRPWIKKVPAAVKQRPNDYGRFAREGGPSYRSA